MAVELKQQAMKPGVGPMPRLKQIADSAMSDLLKPSFDVSDVLAIIRQESMGIPWECIGCGTTSKRIEEIAKLAEVDKADVISNWQVTDANGIKRFPRFALESDKIEAIEKSSLAKRMPKLQWLKFACRFGLGGALASDIVLSYSYDKKLQRLHEFLASEEAQVRKIVDTLESLTRSKPFDAQELFSAYRNGDKRGIYSAYGAKVADISYRLKAELAGLPPAPLQAGKLDLSDRHELVKHRLLMRYLINRAHQGHRLELRQHIDKLSSAEVSRICAGNYDPRLVIGKFNLSEDDLSYLAGNQDRLVRDVAAMLGVIPSDVV